MTLSRQPASSSYQRVQLWQHPNHEAPVLPRRERNKPKSAISEKNQLQHLHLSRICMITYAISVFRRMSPRYLDNCNRRKSPRIVIGESRQTYTNNMLAKNCRRDSPFEKRIKGRSSSNIYKQLYAWALGVLRHIHIYIYMIIKDRQRNMLACALTATFSCLGKVQIFR